MLERRVGREPGPNRVVAVVIPCDRIRDEIESVLKRIGPESLSF